MPKNKDGKKFAVLMDGTNCFFEIKTKNPRFAAYEKRMVWVHAIESFTTALGEPWQPHDRVLWHQIMEARYYEPRKCEGRVLLQEDYWRAVNLRALRLLLKQERQPERFERFVTPECAAFMFEHHHSAAQNRRYTVYNDMQEFVRWLTDPDKFAARLIMITSQRRKNIEQLFKRTEGRLIRDKFETVITQEDVFGLDKTLPQYWSCVFQQTGVSPQEAIVIGSNSISDGYAAQAGVHAAHILDRDSCEEEFFVRKQFSTTRGVPVVRCVRPIPKERHLSFLTDLDGGAGHGQERLLRVKQFALEERNGAGVMAIGN